MRSAVPAVSIEQRLETAGLDDSGGVRDIYAPRTRAPQAHKRIEVEWLSHDLRTQ